MKFPDSLTGYQPSSWYPEREAGKTILFSRYQKNKKHFGGVDSMLNTLLQLIKKEETKKEGLEKYYSLTQKITIYVPSTRNVNEQLTEEEHEKYVNYVMMKMTSLFGGATAEITLGSYESKEKGFVVEKVTKVYSLTGEMTKEQEKEIEKLAQWLKKELTQESVLIEIEPYAKGYFVE